MVQVHTGSLSHKHGLGHHKLTTIHDPLQSSFLSAESAESAEVVPVVPAALPAADPALASGSASISDGSASAEVPVVVVKRDVPATPTPEVVDILAAKLDPNVLVPVCPGRIRFF